MGRVEGALGAWWPHLRAAFVGFHLVAVTLVGLPSVGSSAMNRTAWQQPTVQGEFAAWAGRLSAVGLHIDAASLEQRAWDFAVAFEAGREWVLTPFEPYYKYCGTYQSWKMFVAPHRWPTRMEIEIDRGDGFETVFLARSDVHTWRREWFDHDRMRAAAFRFGWPQYKGPRKAFSDWLAEQLAEAFPDAKRMRVSFLRSETPTPSETANGVTPRVTRELANLRDLDAVRAGGGR